MTTQTHIFRDGLFQDITIKDLIRENELLRRKVEEKDKIIAKERQLRGCYHSNLNQAKKKK